MTSALEVAVSHKMRYTNRSLTFFLTFEKVLNGIIGNPCISLVKLCYSLITVVYCGMCSSQRQFYQCVYAVMTSGCNEEIADVIVEFNIRKYTPSLVADIQCNLSNLSLISQARGSAALY